METSEEHGVYKVTLIVQAFNQRPEINSGTGFVTVARIGGKRVTLSAADEKRWHVAHMGMSSEPNKQQ